MADASDIKEHAEVIGADGVHVGTVDHVDGRRIKLTKTDSHGSELSHHHYIDLGLVAEVEGDQVRLSANADVAVTLEEEEDGRDASEADDQRAEQPRGQGGQQSGYDEEAEYGAWHAYGHNRGWHGYQRRSYESAGGTYGTANQGRLSDRGAPALAGNQGRPGMQSRDRDEGYGPDERDMREGGGRRDDRR